MIPRSLSELEREAKAIGQMATDRTKDDNRCIQVLSALVEELASQVDRLSRRVEAIDRSAS